MYIEEESLDDLLNRVYSTVLSEGIHVQASKGLAKEKVGAFLRLKNPRARLSASETRLKLLSALGEFIWYVAGSDDQEFISHYISFYKDVRLDNGRVPGAYGPRLFGANPYDQFTKIVALLQQRPTSRRAVAQIYRAEDLNLSLEMSASDLLEVPCTCTLQFLLRDGTLHLVAHMRSNDAYMGLPHDVFCFTMLQELAARSLGVEPGPYTHIVGSLHLYDKHWSQAENYLKEGWHQDNPMPPMPLGDQMTNVTALVEVERAIRLEGNDSMARSLDPYWRDIAFLLQAFSATDRSPRDAREILRQTRANVQCELYRRYLLDREHEVEDEDANRANS